MSNLSNSIMLIAILVVAIRKDFSNTSFVVVVPAYNKNFIIIVIDNIIALTFSAFAHNNYCTFITYSTIIRDACAGNFSSFRITSVTNLRKDNSSSNHSHK